MTAPIDLSELIIENFDRVDRRYQAMLMAMATVMLGSAAKQISLDVASHLLCVIPEIAGESTKKSIDDAKRLVELFHEATEKMENRSAQ